MHMEGVSSKKTLLTPPGGSAHLLYLGIAGAWALCIQLAGARARRGQRKIVVDNGESPLGRRRWARMGMVPRPGGGLSGFWARREEASPEGALSHVCETMGMGVAVGAVGGAGKIGWGAGD